MSAAAADAGPLVALFPVLDDAIARGATPGLQLSVRWRDGGAWRSWDHVAGRLGYERDARPVALDTPYDLASVTKAMVALATVRAAWSGRLALDAALASFVDEARGHEAADATLRSLLSHRASLPAWRPYYQSVTPADAESGAARARLLADVARTPREPAGGAARYSDVGYILLGEAAARGTGRALPDLVRDEVAAPLGLDGALHYRGVGPEHHDPRVAPTERCAWRARVIQGHVHDENAYALGGVSGHAGLFGTARAVADVGRAALDALAGSRAWFAPEAMREMVRALPGGSHRLGWDGRSTEGSSAGARMSAAAFGHLGFTGTSLWCDPEADVAVALVTNRVHPTRENLAIRPLRVAVHDAVMAALRGAR